MRTFLKPQKVQFISWYTVLDCLLQGATHKTNLQKQYLVKLLATREIRERG